MLACQLLLPFNCLIPLTVYTTGTLLVKDYTIDQKFTSIDKVVAFVANMNPQKAAFGLV